MNKKLHLFLVCVLFIGFQTSFSQEVKVEPAKPIHIGYPDKVETVPSLNSRRSQLVRPDLTKPTVMKDGRSSRYDIVIGKGSTGDDVLAKNKNRLSGKITTRTPELVFETGASSSQPTDPAGAVGPNHYISVINTAFQIFDKSGNSLTSGLVSPTSIFTLSNICCDLTASYDHDADRWVLSILSTTAGTQVAVSDGPDPVNDTWSVYTYSTVSDYQKLSVWRDGYYMTENTGSANKLHVFEREAMIDGDPATVPQILSFSLPGLVTSGFHSPQVANISGGTWPTSGGATIMYLQDDAWGGVSEDHIKVWTATMDWATPGNSSVSAPQELRGADGVTSFISVFDGGSFSNLTQPSGGVAIDALQATVMNQAQIRQFGSYNSMVFNFVVDVDGSSVEQAGVRWYELRQTSAGQPWTIHQEGTYTAPDNRHAWNASLIMDVQGNIGMGYSGMSSANSTDANVRVGSYYTGRFAADPLGTMTVAEGTIQAGNANIPGLRYGDYSKIDIDPANGKKFWFVNEVMNNGRKNVAGVFQIAPNFNDDLGVVSIDAPTTGALSASESITVTIFNFGENDASTFNVTYQIDGGGVVSEAYSGPTIASNTSQQYTFSTTANLGTEGQTYTILASTDYGSDQDNSNDSTSADVTHVFANDIGVTAITAPVTNDVLGNEPVTVTIENFGTASQSNFDVSYTLNGGTPVVEQVAGPLAGGATTSYTFTTLADLSADGMYTIVAQTQLGGDSVPSNDSTSVDVENTACSSDTNDTDVTILPDLSDPAAESVITITNDVVISDVNVTVNIDHNWITDVDMKLIGPDGTEVILANDVGGSADDMTDTVFDDQAGTAISDGSAPFTGTWQPQGSLADFNGKSSLGDWTLHINDDEDGIGGTLLSWSLEICSNPALSVDEVALDGDFRILNLGNDQFQISLTSDTLIEDLDLNVYNMLGQNLLWKTLKNEGGSYTYNLNMSYAASGIYLIRVRDGSSGVTKRIVVE
jgi:subtilisin-like proprotein convertase family protein